MAKAEELELFERRRLSSILLDFFRISTKILEEEPYAAFFLSSLVDNIYTKVVHHAELSVEDSRQLFYNTLHSTLVVSIGDDTSLDAGAIKAGIDLQAHRDRPAEATAALRRLLKKLPNYFEET